MNAASRLYPQKRFFSYQALAQSSSVVDKLRDLNTVLEDFHRNGTPISSNFALSLLQDCNKTKDLECGRQVQSFMSFNGLDTVAFLVDRLIHLFISCKSLIEANWAFHKVRYPSFYTWSAIILANARFGLQALELYHRMQMLETKYDKYAYSAALKACTGASDLIQSLEEAQDVFDRLPSKNAISWGSMITGHANHGQGLVALDCFQNMQQKAIKPDKATYLAVLKACGNIGAIYQGRLIHNEIFDSGFLTDVVLATSIIDMYGKCGNIEAADTVFLQLQSRDAVSWGAIIAGYAQVGEGTLALELFKMMQDKILKPEKATFCSIIRACGNAGEIEEGRLMHIQVINNGLVSDVYVVSALIDMYAKAGCLDEARKVFNESLSGSVVTWGAMIEGYNHCDEGVLAVRLIDDMQEKGVEPDKITYLSTLKAIGSIGAMQQGRVIHERILCSCFLLDAIIGTSLIDMYSKCGTVEEARTVLDNLVIRDAISWDTMITGYAYNANANLAWKCIKEMQQRCIKTTYATFTGMLAACSRAGLLDEGRCYFVSMKKEHGITPDVPHYNCMVDLLGRAGCFTEAEELLQSLNQPNIIGWTSLLNACELHGNVSLGRRCFDKVVCLDFKCTAGYILMANIYAAESRLGDANSIQEVKNLAAVKRNCNETDYLDFVSWGGSFRQVE